MIRSVVREYKWSPADVGDLFLDEVDYTGLVFWYKDVKTVHAELKEANRKRK